jgi:hypothetical protein
MEKVKQERKRGTRLSKKASWRLIGELVQDCMKD